MLRWSFLKAKSSFIRRYCSDAQLHKKGKATIVVQKEQKREPGVNWNIFHSPHWIKNSLYAATAVGPLPAKDLVRQPKIKKSH